MSEPGHGDERGHDHDHDYAVVARPYVRVRVRADTGERGPDALSVTIDYDRTGVDAPGKATNGAGGGRDVEWRGIELAVYRNGKQVFDSQGGLNLDTSEVLGYVDDVAMALGQLSRRLR